MSQESNMKILVLGATGATGRLVVQTLLQQQHHVVALVRDTETLNTLTNKFGDLLTQIKGTALTLSDAQLSELVKSTDGVISCLGHNLTLKGIFGAPQMMVRDSLKRIISLNTHQRTAPLKMILMNSSGVRNKDQYEPISLWQHAVLALLRTLLPPHRDNEQAANYLRTLNGLKSSVQWVIVRPDALFDQDKISDYSLYPAPIRSAIFDSGKVSRINVASVMSRLLTDSKLWNKWHGKMPLIYNSDECE